MTETVTEFVTEEVTDYITKTLYRTVSVFQLGSTPRQRRRGIGTWVTEQVPYEVTEAVVKTIETPVHREVTREISFEVTRDITVDVQKEVTASVDAGFFVQVFDANGKALNQSMRLDQASSSTYEAELLFNLDLNNDSVQGRNIQELDESRFHQDNEFNLFKGASNTNLLKDVNSRQIHVASASSPDQQTALTNADGSVYAESSTQTVVAAETDANGSINLLSWDQANKSFNLQLFGANGELTGSAVSLSK